MKKIFYLSCLIFLSACVQDVYRLKVDNGIGRYHGQSIYFRSNMRSSYAGQIRRVLSRKFSEIGMKTAASAETADFIAIFDIEPFYKQERSYKNISFANTVGDTPLFTSAEDGNSLAYTGNANMNVAYDKTCFTLKIGRKDTSTVSYASDFCARGIVETENMLPMVLNIYEQYASYGAIDVAMQCMENADRVMNCQAVRDRRQSFINSLWIDHQITDDMD